MMVRRAGGIGMFALVTGAWVAVGASPASHRGPAPELVRSVERSIREVSGDELLGAAVCFRVEGEPLLEVGYGWARAPWEPVSPGRPMGPYTVVPGASTGKAVNAAALLTALGRRGLSADVRVVDLLPPEFGPYGAHVHEMTVAHLLSHTSGFDFRDVYWREDVSAHVREVLSEGSERPPGGDPARGLWTAGQGPPPPDWPGSVYSNVNYFVARVLTEYVTGRTFEDVVGELVLRPAGLAWSPDAEPEPRTLGYSRWMPESPGRREPASFRGHAGPAGWHVSACGLAEAGWSLFGGGGLDEGVRRSMMTRQLGIMSAEERGLPIWIHSGVWTPGGQQGFELGLGFFPGGVGAGFATNTWANVRGGRVLRTVWREHIPIVEVVPTGPGTVRASARYDRVEGAELHWTTDRSVSLATAPTTPGLEAGVRLPARGTLRVAAFLDGRWASLPVEVPLASAGGG